MARVAKPKGKAAVDYVDAVNALDTAAENLRRNVESPTLQSEHRAALNKFNSARDHFVFALATELAEGGGS